MHFGVGEVHFGRTATHFVNIFVAPAGFKETNMFFVTKLVVTSVPVKTPIFESSFSPYAVIFVGPKKFVFVFLFGPLILNTT